MIILLLLTYLNLFTFGRGIQNIECAYSYSTSTISNGEYAFFRSPAFPKTLTDDCEATFQTNSGNNFWFAMYNGVTGGISFGTYSSPSYNSNNDVLIFSTTTSTTDFVTEQTVNPKWIAFESVVLSYNPILNSCPFAQKNITLDTNMIIPIASDFGPEKIHASCYWTFTVGSNQQLKVVIKKLKFASGFTFTLNTDGKNIASFNSDITPDNPKIYYFDSSSGVFQFNMNNANSTNANFVAFISKVDKTTTANTVTCKNESVSSNYITVFNVNYETGYNAFDTCEYKFAVPSHKELVLHVDDFFVEKYADIISLTNNILQLDINSISYYHLLPNSDGSVMKFSADGSIQQAGFSLHYNIIDCKCANSSFVVPCSGGTLFPTANDRLYCSNLKCNYTLIKDTSCSYDHFTLQLNVKMRGNMDFINVYLNGKLNEKLTSVNSDRKAYSFNSHPLLEFHSGDNGNGITDFENSWSIDANYGDPLNILLTHNLTTTNPTYVIWLDDMQFNDAVVVCTSTENALEMFLSSYTCDGPLSNYGLYDSQSLENFVLNLNSANICSQNAQNLPSKISSSGCFTLYNINSTATTNTTILFRLKEVHSKNCAVNNVVKVLESINSTFSISSNSAGSCEITILSAVTSNPIFGIKFTEITSSSNVVYTFKSPINQNKILDLKSSEIFNYLPLSLYTPALSVIIPSGKTLKFTK